MKSKIVWCVCASYNYEGESLEGVYSTEAKAKKHPPLKYADEMKIYKMKVDKKIKPE